MLDTIKSFIPLWKSMETSPLRWTGETPQAWLFNFEDFMTINHDTTNNHTEITIEGHTVDHRHHTSSKSFRLSTLDIFLAAMFSPRSSYKWVMATETTANDSANQFAWSPQRKRAKYNSQTKGPFSRVPSITSWPHLPPVVKAEVINPPLMAAEQRGCQWRSSIEAQRGT